MDLENLVDSDGLPLPLSGIPAPSFQISGQVAAAFATPTQNGSELCNISATLALDLKELKEVKTMNEAGNVTAKNIEQKTDRIAKELLETVNKNSKSIEELKQENDELRHKYDNLQNKCEQLECELNYQNLVISGLPELTNESADVLKAKISEMLQTITGKHIIPDTVYRIGTYKHESCRPIRIRFASHSDRNAVLQKRDQLPRKVSIKPDLPFSIRRDHGILRKKKDELALNVKLTEKIKPLPQPRGTPFRSKKVKFFPVKPH
ncbi:unnamed protein product [Orchesella dallaii]|uniref:Uncharacterized protein n=1 Tax=Orchesella dallaii TaxID=48710 RepID=A0ABP1QRJ3_9HEXA